MFGSTAIGVKAFSLEVEARVDNEVLLVGVILAQFNHFLVLILKFSKMKAKIVLVLVDISENVLSQRRGSLVHLLLLNILHHNV